MRELMRTSNPVLISFVEALLRDARMVCHVADRNMSVAEGSIGAFPCRVLVGEDDFFAARDLLIDAGLGEELEAVALPRAAT